MGVHLIIRIQDEADLARSQLLGILERLHALTDSKMFGTELNLHAFALSVKLVSELAHSFSQKVLALEAALYLLRAAADDNILISASHELGLAPLVNVDAGERLVILKPGQKIVD